MTNKTLLTLVLAGLSTIAITSCKNVRNNTNTPTQDTTAVASAPQLHPDTAVDRAIRFYAGISKEGIQMSANDEKAWDSYSATMKQYAERTARNRAMVDSIARNDFADFRDSIDYVFYPFSGADFIYPTLIYPDADTYFLCGLEKTGQPIAAEIKTNYAHYEAYRKALEYFLRASYFITKYMDTDFHNDELDGVCPIITMLMATMDRHIISIKHRAFDQSGNIIDAGNDSNLLEIKFFKTGSNHEQTLYYMSGNADNSHFDADLKTYLDNTLPHHRVGSYLKAASYLMHYNFFSTMRNYIIDHSMAVVEDDSGIPYKYFTDKFDVTLYGHYQRPLRDFGPECYQLDLQEIYDKQASSIHKLPFRIGYNNPSNWLVARRKCKK